MSGRETDGRAESIRQRLRNELRAHGEDVMFGLLRYAVERFLYRLGRSKHRERFVLKGATLFAIWGTAYRPTRDVDFTGYGSSDPEDVIGAFREICNTPDAVDQLVFDTDTITAEPIRDGSEYDGLRITKDFYDVHAMAVAFRFERTTLVQAVRATFERRSTAVEAALPTALAARFYANEPRAAQWRAYVDRNHLDDAPADFGRVGERITAFLQPIWVDLGSGIATAGDWQNGGPWR